MAINDWKDWHRGYDDPGSELTSRMLAVRAQVSAVVSACPPGPITVVSICGGQGLELIGAIEDHARRDDIRGRLIELDVDNADVARRWARDAALHGLEVVTGDAARHSSYAGLPPVDLAVVSGLFGHIRVEDQQRAIELVRALCRPGGSVVWTFFRRDEGRLESLRRSFAERSFEEQHFETLPGEEYRFTVARSLRTGRSEAMPAQDPVFTFGSSRTGSAP